MAMPPESAEDLLRRYAAGERNFRGANLSGADLHGADLRGAKLRDAQLSRADLSRANLNRVNLIGANLIGANLIGANLGSANLHDAHLGSANLGGANLRAAHLGNADLSGANLNGTNLRRADLSGACLRDTSLLNIDLSPLCDADPPVTHRGPSIVDFRTIIKSLRSPHLKGFLQRIGMPEVFIEYDISCAESLDGNIIKKMLQSTFISYGSPDELFARKLYEGFHRNGVTTFFFPEHAVPGKKIGRTVREGVNEYDRVILICSKNSLDRKGVLSEIEHSLSREDRDGGASYVIPVVLDDYLFSGWAPANADVLVVLKDRVAADFRGADADPAKFDAGLLRLMAALKK